MKVSELEGAELDYWIARALGWGKWQEYPHGIYPINPVEGDWGQPWMPSSEWCDGGPLIEEYQVGLDYFASGGVEAQCLSGDPDDINPIVKGSTVLEAACRAIVASVYGEEVPAQEVEEVKGGCS